MGLKMSRIALRERTKRLHLFGERGRSRIFKDSDRLLVFLFSCLLFSTCVKCIVTGNDDMNYLKVICEMKVMPV